MNDLSHLIDAENKAQDLFETIIQKKLLVAGKSEKQLNSEIYAMATELFGIKK